MTKLAKDTLSSNKPSVEIVAKFPSKGELDKREDASKYSLKLPVPAKSGKVVAQKRRSQAPKQISESVPDLGAVYKKFKKRIKAINHVSFPLIAPYEEAKVLAHLAVKELAIEERIQFVLDEHNKVFYENLIKYFFNDPSSLFPLHKGICVISDSGRGKDFAFQAMSNLMNELRRNKFKTIAATEVARKVKNGESIKSLFDGDILIRDMGWEPRVEKSYGNEIQILERVFDAREETYKKKIIKTYISTNLTKSELLNVYGPRVITRMERLCTFVRLQGPNRRSSKFTPEVIPNEAA